MERLELLRDKMNKEGIDYYLIPTADFHGSEYVNDYFKVREYFSGFTGSAGSLLVGRNDAYLWTDGRYFIQAAMELEGTGIHLMKEREEGVPTIEVFLQKNMPEKGVLALDGRLFSYDEVVSFRERLENKEVKISFQSDPAFGIWTDRPGFPKGKVFCLDDELSGESVSSKLGRIREVMKKENASGFFLSKLDDIMWTCNIRGCDVECNPVALSYLYITENNAILFLQEEVWTEELKVHLQKAGVEVKDYKETAKYLENLKNEVILLDQKVCSYTMGMAAKKNCELRFSQNPTMLMKAVKNKTERAHMERLYLLDSVAVTKFIFWLKNNIGKTEITEITAADRLEAFRREIPEFFDLSFPTISGYGANAAMMHYEATEESFAVLKPEGFLLVDSGAQYFGATTDVTRTISLGKLTEEEKEHYNLVAAGMIQMTNTRFLYGCTGRNLDIMAREPLWEKGLDYKCGTGHGVGYILNVHEGPQALRWQYRKGVEEAVFEEGMDVTNEPGIYVEGSHGIRIENVMLTEKAQKNEYGQFMQFHTLTYVPLDREALDEKYLTGVQKEGINRYQKEVFEKVSPYLTEEERTWLFAETLPF